MDVELVRNRGIFLADDGNEYNYITGIPSSIEFEDAEGFSLFRLDITDPKDGSEVRLHGSFGLFADTKIIASVLAATNERPGEEIRIDGVFLEPGRVLGDGHVVGDKGRAIFSVKVGGEFMRPLYADGSRELNINPKDDGAIDALKDIGKKTGLALRHAMRGLAPKIYRPAEGSEKFVEIGDSKECHDLLRGIPVSIYFSEVYRDKKYWPEFTLGLDKPGSASRIFLKALIQQQNGDKFLGSILNAVKNYPGIEIDLRRYIFNSNQGAERMGGGHDVRGISVMAAGKLLRPESVSDLMSRNKEYKKYRGNKFSPIFVTMAALEDALARADSRRGDAHAAGSLQSTHLPKEAKAPRPRG